VLIAQAIFLLERGHTRAHIVTDATDHGQLTHAPTPSATVWVNSASHVPLRELSFLCMSCGNTSRICWTQIIRVLLRYTCVQSTIWHITYAKFDTCTSITEVGSKLLADCLQITVSSSGVEEFICICTKKCDRLWRYSRPTSSSLVSSLVSVEQGRRQVKKCRMDTGHAWRARGARAYNEVWGGKLFLAFGTQRKKQICFILRILQALTKSKHSTPPPPE